MATVEDELRRMLQLQHERTVLAHMVDLLAAKFLNGEQSAEMRVEGTCSVPVVPQAAIERVMDDVEERIEEMDEEIARIKGTEVQDDGDE